MHGVPETFSRVNVLRNGGKKKKVAFIFCQPPVKVCLLFACLLKSENVVEDLSHSSPIKGTQLGLLAKTFATF